MCRDPANAPGRQARGMTLVELLVVIGIIAILIVLLLPAVNSVIESSRRSGCLQNEKQIALAAAQYAAANRQLPGWRNEVTSAVGTQYPSWPVLLLPHLDQPAVFDQWMSGAFFDPSGQVPKAPMLSAFICPSAKRRGTIPGWPSNHYVGNCGTGISFDGAGATIRTDSSRVTDWRIWPGDGVMVDTAPRIKKPLPFALMPQPHPLLDTYWCEVAKQQSEIAAAGITNPVVIRQSMTPDYINANDGLSNTLLFSERSGFYRNGSNPNFLNTLVALTWVGRYQSAGGSTRKMVWGDGLMNWYYTGNIFDICYSDLPWVVGGAYPLPVPAFGLWGNGSFQSPVGGVVNNNTANLTYHYFFASSRHRGGVVAALCDGRTVFLSNDLEPYVYAQLITSSQVNSPAVTSYLNLAPANRRPYILDEKDYQ